MLWMPMSSLWALNSTLFGVNRDIQTQPSARLLCAIRFVHLVSKRRSTMNIRSVQSSNWTSLVTNTTSTPSLIWQCSWLSQKRYHTCNKTRHALNTLFLFLSFDKRIVSDHSHVIIYNTQINTHLFFKTKACPLALHHFRGNTASFKED